MIDAKTTAMVVALAAITVFGALAIIGNQAVFAQVTNTINNAQSQTATQNCNNSGSFFIFITCTINQEMGNCQVGVGANEESEAASDFESGDCS